jgi:hypothetical protein
MSELIKHPTRGLPVEGLATDGPADVRQLATPKASVTP